MILRTLVAVLAALSVAACGGDDDEPEPASAGELRDVSGVLDLRAAFNEDEGRPRVLLLLSPT